MRHACLIDATYTTMGELDQYFLNIQGQKWGEQYGIMNVGHVC